MCLIVHRELAKSGRGGHIPNDVIQFNKNFNKDGFGLAWRDGDIVRSMKFAPKDFDAFHTLLKTLDGDSRIEYTAHFRTATHGEPCQDFSHPFIYEDAEVGPVHVFHNGVINIPTTKDENDTKVFVDFVLANLPAKWWEQWGYKWMVEEAIGWSRLLVMTNEETHRFNESAWYEIDGLWYSTWPLSEASRPKKNAASYTWATTPKPTPTRYIDAVTWSAKKLSDNTEDEYDRESDTDVPVNLTPGDVDKDGLGWEHEGHLVSPITQDDRDGDDKCGTVICETCDTAGEYYIFDGRIFCDLNHIEVKPEVSRALALVG